VKVLITGCNGLVGQKLVELFARCNFLQPILTSYHESTWYDETELPYRRMDIRSRKEVREIIDELEPEIIVNAAAIANVDMCERERAIAWQTNVGGTENLIYAAKLVGAKIIHLSTDYVFDGKGGPYDEYARPNPINYYGKTKLAAENILKSSGVDYAIARIIFLYGAGYQTKKDFTSRILAALEMGATVRAPEDQYSNPTLADDVAYAILKIIERKKSGVYHIGGPEWINRYEFARKIAAAFGYDKRHILPVMAVSLQSEAQRPLRSGFITLKASIDLDLKTTSIEQGLMVLKSQLQLQAKRVQESSLT